MHRGASGTATPQGPCADEGADVSAPACGHVSCPAQGCAHAVVAVGWRPLRQDDIQQPAADAVVLRDASRCLARDLLPAQLHPETARTSQAWQSLPGRLAPRTAVHDSACSGLIMRIWISSSARGSTSTTRFGLLMSTASKSYPKLDYCAPHASGAKLRSWAGMLGHESSPRR